MPGPPFNSLLSRIRFAFLLSQSSIWSVKGKPIKAVSNVLSRFFTFSTFRLVCYRRTITLTLSWSHFASPLSFLYNRKVITLHGLAVRYRLLDVLEFDATRKCMTVVLRPVRGSAYDAADTPILVLCKGAETAMLPKVCQPTFVRWLIRCSTLIIANGNDRCWCRFHPLVSFELQ